MPPVSEAHKSFGKSIKDENLKLQDVLTGKDILSYMYIILVWNDSLLDTT
jgi:hypothetical protein